MQNAGMPTFLEQHADKVVGALSCFDRVLLRGYPPLESGWTMAEFLRAKGVDRLKLKPFLLEQAERLKKHSFKVAKETGRPCQYLTGHARKDELAQEIAKKDGVEHGLVCVFSVVEPCRSFSLVWKNRKTFIRPAKRQCLFLYYYFLDWELGQTGSSARKKTSISPTAERSPWSKHWPAAAESQANCARDGT